MRIDMHSALAALVNPQPKGHLALGVNAATHPSPLMVNSWSPPPKPEEPEAPDHERVAWLRATIEGDRELAESATLGTWEVVVDEHFPSRQEVSIWCEESGDYITEEIKGGPRHHADASHIARHDPQDTIARCEAELRLLNGLLPDLESADGAIRSEWNDDSGLAETLVTTLLTGYRHRPGFKPEWVCA